jgi:hypothetical protein
MSVTELYLFNITFSNPKTNDNSNNNNLRT